MKEKDINSLDHTRWRCKYHVVFAPKYRRMALIYINSDNNEIIQRFSIVHELGHLITDAPNYWIDDNYTLSTHINSDITLMNNEELDTNEFLVNEQIANIFALLVLIPDEITVGKIAIEGCTELAVKYKVSKEANRFVF